MPPMSIASLRGLGGGKGLVAGLCYETSMWSFDGGGGSHMLCVFLVVDGW